MFKYCILIAVVFVLLRILRRKDLEVFSLEISLKKISLKIKNKEKKRPSNQK
ncbi:MAG: hypothetical protein ACRDAU_17755 [Clostridium sp.]